MAYLCECPFDDFMHQHLRNMISGVDVAPLGAVLDVAKELDPIMVALIYESCLSVDRFESFKKQFDRGRT